MNALNIPLEGAGLCLGVAWIRRLVAQRLVEEQREWLNLDSDALQDPINMAAFVY